MVQRRGIGVKREMQKYSTIRWNSVYSGCTIKGMETMAPDKTVGRITVPVSRKDRVLFTKAAEKAAPSGYRPNRSAWLRGVALEAAGRDELLPREIADAERDYEGWTEKLPVVGEPADLKKIKAAADRHHMGAATFIRAVGRMRAKELGVE